MAQLHAWVRFGAECMNTNDGRGCDMANAAVELAESDHPARRVIEEFKTASSATAWRSSARDAGVTEAGPARRHVIVLLLEGARVSRQSVGAEGPCARFITSAEAVIASFLHKSGDGKPARATKPATQTAKAPWVQA